MTTATARATACTSSAARGPGDLRQPPDHPSAMPAAVPGRSAVGHPCIGCTEQGVGFQKPIHMTSKLKNIEPPLQYPRIVEEKGTGATFGSAAVLAAVAGAAAGAGAMVAKNPACRTRPRRRKKQRRLARKRRSDHERSSQFPERRRRGKRRGGGGHGPADAGRSARDEAAAAGGTGLLYDATLCVGCKTCVAACKQANDNPAEFSTVDQLWDTPLDTSGKTFNLIKMYRSGTMETKDAEENGYAFA